MDSEFGTSFYVLSDITSDAHIRDTCEEKRIGKEETTSLDGVWKRQKGEKKDTNAIRRNEGEEKSARIVRSPQEFDDDVEWSAERGNRNNRGKGKGRENNPGQKNGKGQNKNNGKGNGNGNIFRRRGEGPSKYIQKIVGESYKKLSLTRESPDKLKNILREEGSRLPRTSTQNHEQTGTKDGDSKGIKDGGGRPGLRQSLFVVKRRQVDSDDGELYGGFRSGPFFGGGRERGVENGGNGGGAGVLGGGHGGGALFFFFQRKLMKVQNGRRRGDRTHLASTGGVKGTAFGNDEGDAERQRAQ
jgi:hypothetical protein